MLIAHAIAQVRETIIDAAQRVGRNPEDITLMAVTKTCPAERIREAYQSGLRVFGENRVQEFEGKIDLLRDLADAEWHMIGHLQTNKTAKTVSLFSAVDSLDSVRVAERLNSAAAALGKKLPVLIEINVGRETVKNGIFPDSPELDAVLQVAPKLDNLQVRGLMTVPPFTDDPEQARPYFRNLRDLRDQIAARRMPAICMDSLSMGMSHDFHVAIEEGSTCVRVGTAIFGKRGEA